MYSAPVMQIKTAKTPYFNVFALRYCIRHVFQHTYFRFEIFATWLPWLFKFP